MGAVYAYVIILTLIGPEYLGHQFGIAHDQDLEEAVGHDAIEHVIHHEPALIERNGSSEGDEKGHAGHHV
jgi:SHS family lactate transporter-like MFS transporter